MIKNLENGILNYLYETKCSNCLNRLFCKEEYCFYYQIENVFTNDKNYKNKDLFDNKFIKTLNALYDSLVFSFPDALQLVNSFGYDIKQSKIIVDLYSNIYPYIKGSDHYEFKM